MERQMGYKAHQLDGINVVKFQVPRNVQEEVIREGREGYHVLGGVGRFGVFCGHSRGILGIYTRACTETLS